MSYEAGSRECRSLIDAKDSLIKIMQSLSSIEKIDHIQAQLRQLYNELDQMHELRKEIEYKN